MEVLKATGRVLVTHYMKYLSNAKMPINKISRPIIVWNPVHDHPSHLLEGSQEYKSKPWDKVKVGIWLRTWVRLCNTWACWAIFCKFVWICPELLIDMQQVVVPLECTHLPWPISNPKLNGYPKLSVLKSHVALRLNVGVIAQYVQPGQLAGWCQS